ncbi:hypothetical protein A9Q84_13205 [Halobacteriovorax marinus]|uniref:Uncharacterized protein n=1 Tax=Halobacteriovorax marinus TaxID=97084 RepID=A0A1Y5F8Q4_9BACT|nr:hypothetical protein A9Q84_13205 [Halobacteriovorax marinus]
MNNLKKLIAPMAIALSLTVQGAGTGSFAIQNTDFKEIFNNYRYASPKNIPWAGSYWAYGRDGLSHKNIKGQEDNPPAKKYDAFWGITEREQNTTYFELKSHSCSKFEDDPETKKSCEGWWGHCNAWSAAAIKEEEPRKSFTAKNPKGVEFEMTVADQKGLITELWMSSGSLFAGNTHKGVTTNNLKNNYLDGTKKWVFDKTDSEGQALTRSGDTAYDAFWDVSPRTFFLIFTNYVGVQQTGVVIDRFTGDQVWNQPIVGYRILPIKTDDIKDVEVSSDGQKRYPVLMRMKMFWAEDGVAEGEISDKFNIETTDDEIRTTYRGILEEEKFGKHYSGRLVEFMMFFDAPMVMSEDGKKVVSAGRIVGEGLWYHQTEAGRKRIENMDNTHPDFIWLPTKISGNAGNRNPLVQDKYVRYIFDNKVSQTSTSTDSSELRYEQRSRVYKLKNYLRAFKQLKPLGNGNDSLKKKYIAYMITNALTQEGYSVKIEEEDVTLNGRKAKVKLTFTEKVKFKTISTLLNQLGIIGRF